MLKNNIKQLNEIIFQNKFKNYSAAAAILIFMIATLAILGWEFNIELFKHFAPQLVTINPMTAVALIFSSVSLLLLVKTPAKKIFVLGAKLLAAGSLNNRSVEPDMLVIPGY